MAHKPEEGGARTPLTVEFRSDFRSSLEARLDAFVAVNTEVSDDLRFFFEVAEGKAMPTKVAIEDLRKSLYDSVTQAQTLAAQIGSTEGILSEYQVASIQLMEASEVVTGPLNGAQLMEAASDYLVAEKQLREAALSSYKEIF